MDGISRDLTSELSEGNIAFNLHTGLCLLHDDENEPTNDPEKKFIPVDELPDSVYIAGSSLNSSQLSPEENYAKYEELHIWFKNLVLGVIKEEGIVSKQKINDIINSLSHIFEISIEGTIKILREIDEMFGNNFEIDFEDFETIFFSEHPTLGEATWFKTTFKSMFFEPIRRYSPYKFNDREEKKILRYREENHCPKPKFKMLRKIKRRTKVNKKKFLIKSQAERF